ncbi:ATP-binding cassette domain-containing protein [Sphingobacterium kyonggiense]
MIRHILQYFLHKNRSSWIIGLLLAIIWSISFIALPTVAGWFLVVCSIVFATGNSTFSYLFPSSIIRFIAIVRTATKYFDKTRNHKTVLGLEQYLQLHIFKNLGALPYYEKQVHDHSEIAHTSLKGIQALSNFLLLWFFPFIAFLVSSVIAGIILWDYALSFALIYVAYWAIAFFLVPTILLKRNKTLHQKAQEIKREQKKQLLETLEASIEIKKLQLTAFAIDQQQGQTVELHKLNNKIRKQAIALQQVSGLLFTLLAINLLFLFSSAGESVQVSTGIFLGILALTELAELLFFQKAINKELKANVQQIDKLLATPKPIDESTSLPILNSLELSNWSAQIPNEPHPFPTLSFKLQKGKWQALVGPTGVGKSTLLNSLFYPEYQASGSITWNGSPIQKLSIPQCIYMSQNANLLTGTIQENFLQYSEAEIEHILELVDLKEWYTQLPEKHQTWIGEKGVTLSGGQRKKLLLAQSFIQSPELIILDEPTAGIDRSSARLILDNLKREFPEVTVLLVTHQLELLEQVDEVVRVG